jgi:hypothetical protein
VIAPGYGLGGICGKGVDVAVGLFNAKIAKIAKIAKR